MLERYTVELCITHYMQKEDKQIKVFMKFAIKSWSSYCQVLVDLPKRIHQERKFLDCMEVPDVVIFHDNFLKKNID